MSAQQAAPPVEPIGEDDAEPNGRGLAFEQARRVGYQAELARLDLEERTRKLLPVAEVRDATTACAERLVHSWEQLSLRAEENAAAVAKDGVAGARSFL